MKKNLLFLAALCTAFVAGAQNGATLEYKIASGKGYSGVLKINYSELGSLSDFNMVVPQMPGGGISSKSLVQKSTPDVIYMINDKTKTYSEVKPADLSKDDTKTYSVKKLADETINGYKCTHALVTEGNETHEVWNTKDVADFEKYAQSFKNNKRTGSVKRDQALKAAGCDGLPVKTVHKGNDREGEMTMELVKMEKKTFGKSEFEIPAGYTRGGGAASPAAGGVQVKSQQEIMNMSPEERAKYVEELKKQYGK